jgi:hypothetical protein
MPIKREPLVRNQDFGFGKASSSKKNKHEGSKKVIASPNIGNTFLRVLDVTRPRRIRLR